METIVVRAPVRVDFAGGTTDVVPVTQIGGAVLNCGIKKYVYGKLFMSGKRVGLEYYADIPTSSGLGTSGAMTLVWLTLVSKIKGKVDIKEKIKLAEQVKKIEGVMGITGGKQDEYAAALGGINFLEFMDEDVKVYQLKLKESAIKELENHLVLYYTGKPHFASEMNAEIIKNFRKGKNIENMIRIREIAREMKDTLLKNDLEKFSQLINEELKERKKLHRKIVPKKMEDIIKFALKHGAESAKICGAGGGGTILFYCSNKGILKRALNCWDFKFDFDGLKFLKS